MRKWFTQVVGVFLTYLGRSNSHIMQDPKIAQNSEHYFSILPSLLSLKRVTLYRRVHFESWSQLNLRETTFLGLGPGPSDRPPAVAALALALVSPFLP